jgi:hypothetical protein
MDGIKKKQPKCCIRRASRIKMRENSTEEKKLMLGNHRRSSELSQVSESRQNISIRHRRRRESEH